MNRIPTTPILLAALLLRPGEVADAQENPDPALLGVSRSQIEASGYPLNSTVSLRGTNQSGASQIPRGGFDLINDGTLGAVLIRAVRHFPDPVDCAALTDDAFFLVTVAGRPGDADGDGRYCANAGSCAARQFNNPANPRIEDGVGVEDPGLLSRREALRLSLDRNCDGNEDLVIALTNDPLVPTTLRVEVDDFTGLAGTSLGGQGVAWEAGVFPGAAFPANCPDPATITGHYILRIPQFSRFFPAGEGLHATSFGVVVSTTSGDDGLEEDLTAGRIDDAFPMFAISTGPAVSACAGGLADWSLVSHNDGNVLLHDIVLSDELPAGVSLVGVVSGGVAATEAGGSITFSPFDLAPCESREIVIRVRAANPCPGSGVNTLRADARFRTRCVDPNPGPIQEIPVIGDPATAAFACGPEACPPAATCTISGGGCLLEESGGGRRRRSTFDHRDGGAGGDQWTHLVREGRAVVFDWQSLDARVVACAPATACPAGAANLRAEFVGTGRYAAGPGPRSEDGNMVAFIVDHRGPCGRGSRDEYGIVVRTGPVIGEGAIVYQASGEIDCGNLQVHEAAARLIGSGAQLPAPQSGIAAIAPPDRIVPNPFSNSMTFAYEVPAGGADVEIGIFSVAGRLVKPLVKGPQSAGRQGVTWDGRDEAGVQMARGVYFLKSTVAGRRTAHRVISINP